MKVESGSDTMKHCVQPCVSKWISVAQGRRRTLNKDHVTIVRLSLLSEGIPLPSYASPLLPRVRGPCGHGGSIVILAWAPPPPAAGLDRGAFFQRRDSTPARWSHKTPTVADHRFLEGFLDGVSRHDEHGKLFLRVRNRFEELTLPREVRREIRRHQKMVAAIQASVSL